MFFQKGREKRMTNSKMVISQKMAFHQAHGEPNNLGRQKIQDDLKIEKDSTFSTYFEFRVDSRGSNEEQYHLRPVMEARSLKAE
jgi:hypothetical protein